MFRLGTQRQTPWSWSVALLMLYGAATVSAQSQSESRPENDRPLIRTNRAQLTLAGADRAIAASIKHAEAMGIQVNIAVVDDGGHLLAFARMDRARPASVYTSITKATSAATKRGLTGPLPSSETTNTHLSLAVENAASVSGGKFTTLKGGVPIIYAGQVIGAIGVGGATGEQDAEIASTGVSALMESFESASNEKGFESNALFGNWLIEDIEGRGVVDNAQTTIEIARDGSTTGSTGVNRYMAKATIEGQNIKIEPGPATTRAAGPPALMDQESKFLAALSKVKQYRIDNTGRLHLDDDDGRTLLRASSAKNETSDLYFREDWRETPAQIPVTQDHVANDQLLVTRHGPSADAIKKSHHDEIPNDPWYVWSGMCRKGHWAISLRKKDALVDLSKDGSIRLRVRQSGPNVLMVILELEDGTWLVSDRGIGETPDWHVFTLNLDQLKKNGVGIKWHELDIDTIEAGQRVAKPDLTRVRSIGWSDLTVGKVSKGCTRVDWIEVSGKTAKP